MVVRSILWALGLGLGITPGMPSYAASTETGKIYLSGHWADATLPPLPNTANTPLPGLGFAGIAQNLRGAARTFVRENAALLGLDAITSLSEISIQQSDELETHRFRKTWRGLEVLGGESVVHFHDGQVAFASADATPLLSLPTAATVSAEQARLLAFSSYRGFAHRAETPELKVLLQGSDDARAAHLAYAVKVIDSDLLASDVHYVDASTGQELLVVSNVQPVADRKVLIGGGAESDFNVVTDANAQRIDRDFDTIFSDEGCAASAGFSFWESWKKRLTSDPQPENGAPTACRETSVAISTSALAAWTNSGLVYDYYKTAHNRNSVDGHGLPIRSVVNFGGSAFQNAAWYNDRRLMLYGIGASGTQYNDFAASLDVVGHEITHGVTASTSALLYAGESGALNESYSDVFGKLIAFRNGKAHDWKMGHDLFRDQDSFIRDMENPAVAHVRDFKFRGQECNRGNDFCGVHDNSGIPSKAAVMIAKRLGLERFGKIYYLTLTHLLRSGSDFRDARAQTQAACATLLGRSNADCKVIGEAFSAVGVE